jgi:hypothetical protein
MVSRRIAALLLLFAVAGCANSGTPVGPSAEPLPSSSVPAGAKPSTEPSGPTAAGAEQISGTVAAGVEPNCLVLQDSKGSYLLVFDEPALRADAPVGRKVTLTGRSDPGMMTTCQQGTPFIVTSVTAG